MRLKTGKSIFAALALVCSFISCVTRAHGGRLDEPFKARGTKEYIPTVPVDLENPKTYIRIKNIKPEGLCTEDEIQDIEFICMNAQSDSDISKCVSDGIRRLCNLTARPKHKRLRFV